MSVRIRKLLQVLTVTTTFPPSSKNAEIKTYRVTILPVFLYGHDTCFLTSREEQRIYLDNTDRTERYKYLGKVVPVLN
jgi:hypothetical protein